MTRSEGSLAFLRSSAALFIGKTAFFGVRIIALMGMAKVGAQDVFTCISYGVALGELGRLVADYGTETWSLRAIAISDTQLEKARIVSSALLLKALFGVIAALLIVAVCTWKFGHIGFLAGMFAGMQVLTSQVAGITVVSLQAENQLQRLKVLAAPCLSTAVVVCVVLWATRDPLLALAVLSMGELVAAILLLNVLRQRSMLTGLPSWRATLRQMLRDCAPVALLNALTGIYSRLDTLVVGQVALASLADYTVANRLFLPFQLGIMTLGATVYSRSAAVFGRQGGSLREFLRRHLPLIVLTATVAAGAMLGVGSYFIVAFLPAYRASLAPLAFLSGTVVVSALSSTAAGILWASGRFATTTRIAAAHVGVAFSALLLLVPRYGAPGAAAAMLIAEALTAAILWRCALVTSRDSPVEKS